MRKIIGQVGHGLASGRSSGGRGMISNWWIDAAPWRCAVPRQSAPVSPPPMITTFLPCGGDRRRPSRSPSCTRFDHGRYSIAWWMPSSSRPGIGRSRHAVAPPASTTASKLGRARRPVTSTPTFDAGAELGALGLHLREAAVEVALLHLELGDAVAQQPADAVGPLEHDDVVPGAGRAAARRRARRGRSRRPRRACRSAPTAAPARPSPRPRRGR